ncbi:hypothetical protein [Parapedobacter soli]|uniref:hypothetical protein n=1 Tax=Parapedobacter soli TaxID=416955 RepID=UPI0021C61064|nr:hypothetical protein [Parapedobacter soli]
MDIQAEKLGIIRWLSTLDDRKLISQLVSLKNSTTKQVKLNLSTEEKEAVDAALKSAEEGRVISHEDVMANTRNKYPNLYHNKR